MLRDRMRSPATCAITSVVAAVAIALGAPAALAAGTPLVSLGDSYSSGQGAGPFDRATDSLLNRCHRSANAWPRLLGVPMRAHLACAGARTRNFYAGKTAGRPDNVGQLDRLRAIAAADGPIGRVLVGIGGNDLRFASIVRDCFLTSCLKHMDDIELPRLRNVVRPAVTKALGDTRTASGGADVVLVGYPDIVAPLARRLAHCSWLSEAEKPRLRRLERVLDEELRGAASDAGVPYLSVRPALAGHELCTTEPWVRRVGTLRLPIEQQGHPSVDGQMAIKRAVLAGLGSGARHRSTLRRFEPMTRSPEICAICVDPDRY
jgi:hypothetical protein